MWITQLRAAQILGVHWQTVAKMVARGMLTSRGQFGRRGSSTYIKIAGIETPINAAASRARSL